MKDFTKTRSSIRHALLTTKRRKDVTSMTPVIEHYHRQEPHELLQQPTPLEILELNAAEVDVVGVIEVERLPGEKHRRIERIICLPPHDYYGSYFHGGDEEKEEDDNLLDDEEDMGIELHDSILEQLTFALMNGCASCASYPPPPSKSALRKPGESRAAQSNNHHRSVGFGCLEIHEFYMTLGDHPSAVSGPPVALDYSAEVERTVSVDEYERSRTPRRKRKQLKLSYRTRKNILEEERGFSTQEVNEAWLEALKIRQQRQETLKRGLVMMMWDELSESTQRKYNRFVEAVSQCY